MIKYPAKRSAGKKTLTGNIAYILGGSALAGLGFSFGRDAYKGMKKNAGGLILLAALVFAAVCCAYISALWIFRNYRTGFEAVWRRIVAIALIPLPLFVALLFGTQEGQEQMGSPWLLESYDLIMLKISAASFVVGLFMGLWQRVKRSAVWEVEQQNEEFMENHGLVQYEDGTVEDSINNHHYRVDHIGKDRITLFAIGRRGKRAYIRLNPEGAFYEYTGMVSLNP